MYSSDESDDEETFASNSQSQLYRAGLKPALDNIFAEVQANIPVIGSDSDSEVSWVPYRTEILFYVMCFLFRVVSVDCEIYSW